MSEWLERRQKKNELSLVFSCFIGIPQQLPQQQQLIRLQKHLQFHFVILVLHFLMQSVVNICKQYIYAINIM